MKILIRDAYKLKPDELFCKDISYEYGNELVKMLNKNKTDNSMYYQLVSDDFKKYLDDKINKGGKYE